MSEELTLDVGQANELKLGFRRANWTNADIKRLSEGGLLSTILPVVRGGAVVVIKQHLIDCDKDPFTPDGWEVKEHIRGGQLAFDPVKIRLFLSKAQQKGKAISGLDLREELKGQSVLNACVLDYLLAHPELIPDEWKGKLVFFWGTVYHYPDGNLGVRCLFESGSEWDWLHNWLGNDFHDNYPAAVSAS